MNALKLDFMKIIMVISAIMLLLFALSINFSRTVRAAESPKLEVPVSINAVMVTLIDHSAHYIWDYGVMERNITDEEWLTVEYYAIQLAASGPLITLGGSGPMDKVWMQSPMWIEFSRQMSNAAMLALEASSNKDKAQLVSAGDILVGTCEACHAAFKPDVPTEGYLHMPDYDLLYHLFL